MATEYGTIVRVHADTKTFDEEMNKRYKKIKNKPIDINVRLSERAVEQLNNIDDRFKEIKRTVEQGFKVKKLLDPQEIEKINKEVDKLKNKIEELNNTKTKTKRQERQKNVLIQDYQDQIKELENQKNATEEAYKVTQTFKDKLGETQTVVTYVSESEKILASEVVKSTKVLESKNKSIDEYNTRLKETQKNLQQIAYEETKISKTSGGNKVTETTKRTFSGAEEKTRVYEYEDELGRKVQATTKFIREQGEDWKIVGSTTIRVVDDQIRKEEELIQAKQKEQEITVNFQKQIEKEIAEKNAIAEKNRKLKESIVLREELLKFRDENGNIVSQTSRTNANGQTEIEQIIEKEQEFGVKVQETTHFIEIQKGVLMQVGETTVKVINDEIAQEEKLAQTLETTYEKVERFRDKKTGAEVVQTISIDKDGIETITRLETLTDKFGNTTEKTTVKVRELDGSLKTVSESTKEYTDQIAKEEKWKKEAEENTKRLAKAQEEEAKALQKAKEEREKLNKTVIDTTTKNSSYKKVIDGVLHSVKTISTTTKQYDGTMKTTEKTIDSFKDSQGRLVTTTKELKNGLETTNTVIEDTDKKARRLGQTFGNIVVKVTKFYLASLPVRAVQTAIRETIESVKEFDSALTEFKKVSDLSGKALDDYALKLEKLGELTARTRTEMVQMATEFKRSGYSDEEAASLAQTASLYQNIADEELSAADASSVLISQMKAFIFEADESIHVIDAINEVANKNAVSSGDIGRGLTQAGAALSTYGNTFEETIGLKIRSIKTDLTAGNP